MSERVVATGQGAVSPFGLGADRLLNAVKCGRSAVRFMEEWQSIEGLESKVAAPVPAIDFRSLVKRTYRRNMGRMALYCALAAREAVTNARISDKDLDSYRVGVVMGSTTGSPEVFEDFFSEYLPEKKIQGVRSGTFFKIMSHTVSANVAQFLGIRGEQWSTNSACASSAQAIGLGILLIQSGRQDIVIVGGSDELHPMVTMVFDLVGAASRMNHDPTATPRPFDQARDGVVCGEGAGVLVLESLTHARKRGAPIIAELVGFGHVNDNSHISNPDQGAMEYAMRQALASASVEPEEVDYLNAHATGTPVGDQKEALAIKNVFGDKIPVNSFKGNLGHCLGASAVLEAIVALDAFRSEELLPCLNFERFAPSMPMINVLVNTQRRAVRYILKNSFAFGGVNVSLLFRRYEV